MHREKQNFLLQADFLEFGLAFRLIERNENIAQKQTIVFLEGFLRFKLRKTQDISRAGFAHVTPVLTTHERVITERDLNRDTFEF